jgi:hypothetical protein
MHYNILNFEFVSKYPVRRLVSASGVIRLMQGEPQN